MGRRIILAFLAIVFASLPALGCRRKTAPANARVPVEETDFHRERSAHATRLVRVGASFDALGPQEIPIEARPVLYPSGDLRLLAWVTPDPKDAKRHPAVVYLHGNFALRRNNWDRAQAYRDAGFVTMTPMVRGENGNPGTFECFYGEVDDAIAAGRYLASLPYIDPNHIYLCGHSVGGTLAMLVSLMPSPYRSVAALSGAPDIEEWLRTDGYQFRVYDSSDPKETRLRTARLFPGSICRPLYLMDGDQEWYYIPSTQAFAESAKSLGKHCSFETVPGDHRSFLPEAILRTIKLFNQDG